MAERVRAHYAERVHVIPLLKGSSGGWDVVLANRDPLANVVQVSENPPEYKALPEPKAVSTWIRLLRPFSGAEGISSSPRPEQFGTAVQRAAGDIGMRLDKGYGVLPNMGETLMVIGRGRATQPGRIEAITLPLSEAVKLADAGEIAHLPTARALERMSQLPMDIRSLRLPRGRTERRP